MTVLPRTPPPCLGNLGAAVARIHPSDDATGVDFELPRAIADPYQCVDPNIEGLADGVYQPEGDDIDVVGLHVQPDGLDLAPPNADGAVIDGEP